MEPLKTDHGWNQRNGEFIGYNYKITVIKKILPLLLIILACRCTTIVYVGFQLLQNLNKRSPLLNLEYFIYIKVPVPIQKRECMVLYICVRCNEFGSALFLRFFGGTVLMTCGIFFLSFYWDKKSNLQIYFYRPTCII